MNYKTDTWPATLRKVFRELRRLRKENAKNTATSSVRPQPARPRAAA